MTDTNVGQKFPKTLVDDLRSFFLWIKTMSIKTQQ
jgi:hypothetical protein